jgi:hypothetical protein
MAKQDWRYYANKVLEIRPPFVSADPCAVAEPHYIFFVPKLFGSETFTSGSGAYYYEAYKNHFCSRFIVDVMMATYSNTGPDTGGEVPPSSGVVISGNAYDLPSSDGFGGVVPITEEDCKRFTLNVGFYRKLANETEFTKLSDHSNKSTWESGYCSGPTVETMSAPTSMSGWDTYRAAVSCVLRTTAQEVQVNINQPPPL